MTERSTFFRQYSVAGPFVAIMMARDVQPDAKCVERPYMSSTCKRGTTGCEAKHWP